MSLVLCDPRDAVPVQVCPSEPRVTRDCPCTVWLVLAPGVVGAAAPLTEPFFPFLVALV